LPSTWVQMAIIAMNSASEASAWASWIIALSIKSTVSMIALQQNSRTDEMSIKYKRDKVGDHSGRYDNRRHKPLGHNSSSYE
jgi:hypothetical protein